MKKGFIDRSPLQYTAGIFILIVAILAKSIPLGTLGLFDLGIGFAHFSNPDLADKKTIKLFVFTLYGALILWSLLWLVSKMPQ